MAAQEKSEKLGVGRAAALMVIGAVLGGVIGAIVGYRSEPDSSYADAAGLIYGLVGAAIGAFSGVGLWGIWTSLRIFRSHT